MKSQKFTIKHGDWSAELMTAPAHTLYDLAETHDTGMQNTLVAPVSKPKKRMVFLFDYGDERRFNVTGRRELETRALKRLKVPGTTGTPPVQHPSSGDDFQCIHFR